MSSDAHFTFLRRLGPPDHSLHASNPNGQSTSNSTSYSNSTNAGLRFYLDSRDADPTNNNDRDPFPPTILDRDRIANQVNQQDTEPLDEQDEREDITVRLQHREAISVPWHLLPPYQSDDLDILPSEAHPSYPYGVPFLPTSLPPYSSKPKLPPFSSNSLQYLSSMNLHLPPNQRGGNNPTNRPHVGTTNSTSSNTYHGNGNKIRESLSKNLDSEDLPIDLKMKSKVSTILKPSLYPFKKIGPGKSIRRNPKDYFNKHSVNGGVGGGDSFNLSGTQMEIWSDLGLNEILPKGKEKDPLLDTSNLELSEEVYLLSGSGGVGGISDWKGSHQFPDETYGKGKDKGLGYYMEKEFNRLNLPFFSEHLPSSAYPNRYSSEPSTRPTVPESYAYGRLNQTSTSSHNDDDDLHPSIITSEEQRREEHLRNERLGQEYPNIHRNSNFISNPNSLAHQMEIRIGLDRAERIWATNTRKERVEKHLNEIYAKGKGKGKIDESRYRKEFWDLFLNDKGGKEGQIGYSVLEKDEEDGRRSSKVIKDGVSFSSSVDDEKRKEGGRIRWGEGIV